MKTIIVRLHNSNSSEYSWAEVLDDGKIVHHRDRLENIRPMVGVCKVIALVPGEDILVTSVTLPGSSKNVRQAVPFALEERLSEDVEKLHFVIGEKDNNDNQSVAIISRSLLENWLALLSAANLDPDSVFADIHALPEGDGTVFVCKENDMALVRLDRERCYAVDWHNLEPILLPEVQRLDSPEIILHGGLKDDFSDERLVKQVRVLHDHEDILVLMSRKLLSGKMGMDFLQGRYIKRSSTKRLWQSWRFQLIVLALFLLVYTLNTAFEFNQLRSENMALTAEMKDVLRQSFPESRRVIKPYTQMQYKLDKLRSSQKQKDNFLSLVNQISPIIFQYSSGSIESMRYRNQKIDVTLQVEDLKKMDELKTALIEKGDLAVDIKTANAKGSFVLVGMQIMEKNK